jgi:hypothetical protein
VAAEHPRNNRLKGKSSKNSKVLTSFFFVQTQVTTFPRAYLDKS